jgi:hypothetical protein
MNSHHVERLIYILNLIFSILLIVFGLGRMKVLDTKKTNFLRFMISAYFLYNNILFRLFGVMLAGVELKSKFILSKFGMLARYNTKGVIFFMYLFY